MPDTHLHVDRPPAIYAPAAFAQAIQHQLAASGIVCQLSAELCLTLELHGRKVRMHLEQAYHDYLRDPTRFTQIGQALARKAAQYTPDQLITDFQVLRHAIFPILKPLTLLAELHERQLPMLAYRWWQADLMIAYVIREQHSLAYINADHLTQWQIDEMMLHEWAMRNLQLQTARVAHTTLGTGPRQLFLFNTQDGYDATRILLPDVLEMWHAALGGQLVIGIPHRDLLVAFSDHDPQVLHAVAHQVTQDAHDHPARLTTTLFTYHAGQVQVYTPQDTASSEER